MTADGQIAPDVLEDDTPAFWAVYGPWAPLSVAELAALMEGFREPWWLVGGWAIEAFTGVSRPHEDIDMSFLQQALPAFREQVRGRYHLWSNDGGTFRVIDDEHPEPLQPVAQVWVRRDATSPWVLDIPVSPSVDGRWQSKRDKTHIADIEDVTWVASDGVRYLAPEIALLHKARQPRRKDELDLVNTWPLLPMDKQEWLRGALARVRPDHPWLGVMSTL